VRVETREANKIFNEPTTDDLAARMPAHECSCILKEMVVPSALRGVQEQKKLILSKHQGMPQFPSVRLTEVIILLSSVFIRLDATCSKRDNV